jgi:hypothetical protein
MASLNDVMQRGLDAQHDLMYLRRTRALSSIDRRPGEGSRFDFHFGDGLANDDIGDRRNGARYI